MPVQKCQENNKPGWKWGEHGKCYTGPDAKEKAAEQGRATHVEASMVLQLQTFPACSVGLSNSGLAQFRKELIKVGTYVKDSTKQKFEITLETLRHWVTTFDNWVANGNKVSIPATHEKEGDPEANQGWVTSLFIEGNSLFGIMELLKPELALVSDVSIAVPFEVIDGKGIKYNRPITHVALTTVPVVSGLKGFETLSLSLGDDMDFLKKIAEKLGLSSVTEKDILAALEKTGETVDVNVEKKVELSQVVDPVVKLVSENRALKLSNLLTAGLITPAIKDVITAKYVEMRVLALSMASKQEDGFDILYDVLVQNKPVNLDEVTGVQSLELANQSAVQPNAMKKEIDKRRKDAGLDK